MACAEAAARREHVRSTRGKIMCNDSLSTTLEQVGIRRAGETVCVPVCGCEGCGGGAGSGGAGTSRSGRRITRNQQADHRSTCTPIARCRLTHQQQTWLGLPNLSTPTKAVSPPSAVWLIARTRALLSQPRPRQTQLTSPTRCRNRHSTAHISTRRLSLADRSCLGQSIQHCVVLVCCCCS